MLGFRTSPLFDPAASETPVGGAPAGAAPKPVVDLDQTVVVDGKTVKIADLASSARRAAEIEAKLKAAEEIAEAGKQVFDAGADSATREKAAKRVLMARGMSEEQAMEYLSQLNDDKPGGKDETPAEPPATDPNDIAFRADFISNKLSTLTSGALDGSGPLGTLLKKFKTATASDDPKSFEETRKLVESELSSALIQRAQQRKAAARGVFRIGFLDEEIGPVEKQVAEKYGRIFGNLLDKLGRTPSVLTEEESRIKDSKPVAAPKYKPGMSRGEIDAALDAYNADAVTRLALDLKVEEASGSKA